ncbi:MAG: hypothetical protein ACLR4Z_18655 [Butyricicoccaceae bacterium]
MKKSVVSFIAVLLLICFLGVTAVTGVYIPGGWTMPFRNAETTQSDSADTQTDAASDSTDTSAETTTGSADAAESADTTDCTVPQGDHPERPRQRKRHPSGS